MVRTLGLGRGRDWSGPRPRLGVDPYLYPSTLNLLLLTTLYSVCQNEKLNYIFLCLFRLIQTSYMMFYQRVRLCC